MEPALQPPCLHQWRCERPIWDILQRQLLQPPLLPGFILQSCPVSCIRVQIQLASFITYFHHCCPFPISPIRCVWHFLRAPAGEAHTKTGHVSAAKSLQLTRDKHKGNPRTPAILLLPLPIKGNLCICLVICIIPSSQSKGRIKASDER